MSEHIEIELEKRHKILEPIGFKELMLCKKTEVVLPNIYVKHNLGDIFTPKDQFSDLKLLIDIVQHLEKDIYDIHLVTGVKTHLTLFQILDHFKFFIEKDKIEKELTFSNLSKEQKESIISGAVEQANKEQAELIKGYYDKKIKDELSNILHYLKPPENAKNPPTIDWQVYINKTGEEFLIERLFDLIVEIRKQDSSKIHADLMIVANSGQYEDLRREVERYFKNI